MCIRDSPGGDKFAVFHEGYDKLRKVSDISGKLYNADGVNIRSVKNKEIRDYSNTSEGTLADDDRVKVHDFSYRIYPYTVEYEKMCIRDRNWIRMPCLKKNRTKTIQLENLPYHPLKKVLSLNTATPSIPIFFLIYSHGISREITHAFGANTN